MLFWTQIGPFPDDPDGMGPTYYELLADSGNRKYVISCSTVADDEISVSLLVDGRAILDHEWWPSGRKACGDRDIRTLSDAQHVAEDWEIAITAYELWKTGLWGTTK